MKITCISDLHGFYPELPGGDLLIVAGDLTANDKDYGLFQMWLFQQDYRKIVVIAGNHDGYLEKEPNIFDHPICYLCDSGTEFEGLKIWGSPYTPEFGNWHFMKKRGQEMKEVWDKIPKDVDILITHGPPYGIMDKVFTGGTTYHSARVPTYDSVGCEELRQRLYGESIKPKLHIFGHIHEGYGTCQMLDFPGVTFVNASIMNEHYQPVNKPINITLKKEWSIESYG